MKDEIEKLKPFDQENGLLNVIIETPKGSRVKISYDPYSGLFRLTKVLPQGMFFPFNFGFVPRTLAEDGDPLDALILNDEPLFPGCLLKVKPVAMIKASQTEGGKKVRNDRIIGEAIPKETQPGLEPLKLTNRTITQIEIFFQTYNKLHGKKFLIHGTGGRKAAITAVRNAVKLHERKSGAKS